MAVKKLKNTYQTVKRTYKTKNGIITKVYTYHYDSAGKAIRSTNTGYRSAGNQTRLSTKKGKLTKAGKRLVSEIQNSNITEAEKEYKINRLKEHIKVFSETKDKATTLASFESSLKVSKLERMIYNFGMEPAEIATITNTSEGIVLTEANWDFEKNIFMGQWKFEYDYNEYNGFKFTRI